MSDSPITGVAVRWNAYIPTLAAAAREPPWLDLRVYSPRQVGENPELLDRAPKDMSAARLVLLYGTPDAFWEMVDRGLENLKGQVAVIVTGRDPSFWGLSTVSPEVAATAYRYLVLNGRENFERLLAHLGKEVLGLDLEVQPPLDLPWEGFYHPEADGHFETLEEYLAWYGNRRPVGQATGGGAA
jgi:cobaltochelatase CobN